MHIYCEGSPELGYASKAQIQEHIEETVESGNATRLFPTADENKVSRLTNKVFKQMFLFSPPISSKIVEDKFIATYHDDGLGVDTYEVGVRSDEEDLGDLINLDFLLAVIERRDGGSDFAKPHFTPQVKPIVDSFIGERKQFMGAEVVVDAA